MEKSTFQVIYQRLKIRVFGYDAFISYRRADAYGYAVALKKKLDDELICFLDEEEIQAGSSLPERIEMGLKKSKFMILIASPEAAEPKVENPEKYIDWIDKEITLFNIDKKKIISINIEESLNKFKNLKVNQKQQVFINETFQALTTSIPSETIIETILKSFNAQSVNKRATIAMYSVIFIVLVLSLGIWNFYKAVSQTTAELSEERRTGSKVTKDLANEKKKKDIATLNEYVEVYQGFKNTNYDNYADSIKLRAESIGKFYHNDTLINTILKKITQ